MERAGEKWRGLAEPCWPEHVAVWESRWQLRKLWSRRRSGQWSRPQSLSKQSLAHTYLQRIEHCRVMCEVVIAVGGCDSINNGGCPAVMLGETGVSEIKCNEKQSLSAENVLRRDQYGRNFEAMSE